jgi:hypothetical protein
VTILGVNDETLGVMEIQAMFFDAIENTIQLTKVSITQRIILLKQVLILLEAIINYLEVEIQ